MAVLPGVIRIAIAGRMYMELHLFIYVFLALVYVGYPLFYLMTKPSEGHRRIMGLGLLVYGLLAAFWPQTHSPILACAGALMMAAGFGLYFELLRSHLIWLLLMAYAMAILLWPGLNEPLTTLAAAIVLTVGFERCTASVRRARKE